MALVASAVIALAGQARAQNNALGLPDSLVDWRYKLTPVFEVNSKSDVNANQLGGKFTNTVVGINGLTFTTVLAVSKSKDRLSDRFEVNKQFTNTLNRTFREGLTAALVLNDSRKLSRTAIPGLGFQDFVLNNQSARASGDYLSNNLSPAGWDAHTKLVAQNNEYTFKRDEGAGGSVNGGMRYRFLDQRVGVKVRGSYDRLNEKSSSNLSRFSGLSTTADSLQTGVSVQVSDSIDVDLDWTDYSYERIFADQSRTASGTQNLGAGNLFRETERREYRAYGVGVTTHPLPGLSLDVSAGHTEQISDFVKTPTRYSRIVEDGLDGSLNYTMRSRTMVSLDLSTSDQLRDYGAQSVSSYTDERKRVSLTVSRRLFRTMETSVTVSEAISQQSYLKKKENPKDKDQHESAVTANVQASPFRKIATTLFFKMVSTDYVSLFASQSGDNRNRLRYDLRPAITYTVSDKTSVVQNYSLGIEFTDYDYNLPGQDDFIDRNIGFQNQVKHKLTDNVGTEFSYALTLHDRGAYLPRDPNDPDPNAERFLDIDRKDRTDEMKVSFQYTMTKHLIASTSYRYSQRRDETVGSSAIRYSTDSVIQGGLRGSYQWGEKGSLAFSLERVEKVSAYGTDKQKKYWMGNLALKRQF